MKQQIRKLWALLLPFALFSQEPILFEEKESEQEEIAFLGESIPSSPISLSFSEPVEAAPPFIQKTKNASVAVLLSTLLPGLGHYYLGDIRVGSELLGSSLLGGASIYATKDSPSLSVTSTRTVQSIGFYSIYAAYRDTYFYNGNPPPFMPREDLKSLYAAPFQWSIIKKAEVWGALLGTLGLGVTLAYFINGEAATARVNAPYIEPLGALPIAVGEESFFRGFLQTSFIETLSPWGAIAVSSMVFGAAHIPNAFQLDSHERKRYYAFGLPFITGLGAYMGWLTYKNRSLKESVALHAWYDFVVMSAGVLASQAAIRKETYVSHSWEF